MGVHTYLQGLKALPVQTRTIRHVVDAEEAAPYEYEDTMNSSSADESASSPLDDHNCFDLSWLPGGQPDVVVAKPQKRSERLLAGRDVDLDSTRQGSRVDELHAMEGNSNGLEDVTCEEVPSAVNSPGSFVASHGQQTLSNFAWALATFPLTDMELADKAFDVCCRLFCHIPAETVGAQVRPPHAPCS